MLLRKIKDKIPLEMKQKFRPAIAKTPVFKSILTKPFYNTSKAASKLANDTRNAALPIEGFANIDLTKKANPHFALTNERTTLDPKSDSFTIILGSRMFSRHVFSYHDPKETNLNRSKQISGIHFYNGNEKKLRNILLSLKDEIYLQDFILPKIHIYVDLSNYFKSVDAVIRYASLQKVFKGFEDIKADVSFFTTEESKFQLDQIKKARVSNLKTRTVKVTSDQMVSLRTSNPFIRSNREYKKILGAENQRVLVLGWRDILLNKDLRRNFDDIAMRYPDAHFDLYEPIWNLPLNANTDIHDLPDNCTIKGDLGYNSLYTAGGAYDLVYCINGETLIEHERGQVIALNLLLQGLPLFGHVAEVKSYISKTAAADLGDYIYETDEHISRYLKTPSLMQAEQHLSDVLRCICEWPKTIYEIMLPLAYEEVLKPILYEKGRVVITTHRLTHIENIAENIKVCQKLGFGVTIVMNNLTKSEAEQLETAMESRGIKCDYFRDCKYGLGYGITKAVIGTDSDFWFKIDDDDIYAPGHFLETYAALRIYQTRYCGRRIALYNFIEDNTLYAHKSGTAFPSYKQDGRHVSGACMSGLTSLLQDYEIPKYSFYNMDVAYSKYLESHNEPRFIGSPFFLYVQRYDNGMHTWRFDFQEWAKESVSLGAMPFGLREVNAGKHILDMATSKEELDICFLHRAIPGTIGYGAGTWVPQEAANAGYEITEIVVKEPKAKSEPLVTNFFNRKLTRLHLQTIEPEYVTSALDHYLDRVPSVFHVINMKDIGGLTDVLKTNYPASKVIVEVRTPLLSNNADRRVDMSEALKAADGIITPSQAILETWMHDVTFEDVENKVAFVEPSINIPDAVDVKKLFKKTGYKRSVEAPLRLIYNGSIGKARKINDMIGSILPSLQAGEVTLSLCAEEAEFNKIYPRLAGTENLIFIGTVSNTQMFESLSEHDVLLAWLPQESLYEEAWSTKIVEAALLGLDVIASVTRGHQDMADRGLFRNFYENEPISFSASLEDIRGQDQTLKNKERKSARDAAMNFTWGAKQDVYKTVWGLPKRDI